MSCLKTPISREPVGPLSASTLVCLLSRRNSTFIQVLEDPLLRVNVKHVLSSGTGSGKEEPSLFYFQSEDFCFD